MAAGINIVGKDQWHTINHYRGIVGLCFCITMSRRATSLTTARMRAYTGALDSYSATVD
jgi:hypothetical protein